MAPLIAAKAPRKGHRPVHSSGVACQVEGAPLKPPLGEKTSRGKRLAAGAYGDL